MTVKRLMAQRQKILNNAEARRASLTARATKVTAEAKAAIAKLEDGIRTNALLVEDFVLDHKDDLTTADRTSSVQLETGDTLRWEPRSHVAIPNNAAFVKEAMAKRLQSRLLKKVWAVDKKKARRYPSALRQMTSGRLVHEECFIFEFDGITDRLEIINDTDTGETKLVFKTPRKEKQVESDE